MADNPLKAGGDTATDNPPAEEAPKPARRRSTRKSEEAAQPTGSNGNSGAEKKKGEYHVLESINVKELDESFDGEVFVDLGTYNGLNADKAVDAYLDDNQDVSDGVFLPVPSRHFKRQTVGQEPQPPKRVRQRA